MILSGALDILRADDRFLVRFVGQEDTLEVATRHGFTHNPSATVGGVETFTFAGSNPDAMSTALHGALGDGLQVREVRALTKDLETVMTDAVRGGE